MRADEGLASGSGNVNEGEGVHRFQNENCQDMATIRSGKWRTAFLALLSKRQMSQPEKLGGK